MEEIHNIINETPLLNPLRKELLTKLLDEKYKKVMIPAYNKALEKEKEIEAEPEQDEEIEL